jgi:hypothetical protein
MCPVTKHTAEQVYSRAPSTTAADFAYVKQQLPFSLRSIHGDGGSEFMGNFQKNCGALSIALFVIPPQALTM